MGARESAYKITYLLVVLGHFLLGNSFRWIPPIKFPTVNSPWKVPPPPPVAWFTKLNFPFLPLETTGFRATPPGKDPRSNFPQRIPLESSPGEFPPWWSPLARVNPSPNLTPNPSEPHYLNRTVLDDTLSASGLEQKNDYVMLLLRHSSPCGINKYGSRG